LSANKTSTESNINITTSKKKILSTGRALNSNTGTIPPITADTLWSNVYDDTTPVSKSISSGDQFTFIGTKGDGTAITINNTYTVDTSRSVQDLLDWLENLYDCHAYIDNSGRLVFKDRKANNSINYQSQLAVTDFNTPVNANGHSIFKNPLGSQAAAFLPIFSDEESEDGSRMGDVVSTAFSSEKKQTTQYAFSSRIFSKNYTPAICANHSDIPVIISANPGLNQITLSWEPVVYTGSYNIYLASEAGVNKNNYTSLSDGAMIADVSSPYIITGLKNNIGYYLTVTSVKNSKESDNSQEAFAFPAIAHASYVNLILNLDARKTNETTEARLFESWDGTGLTSPVAPIAAATYEYSTSFRVDDANYKGHQITVYFDRTSIDNQWEFLITCSPEEDKRGLTYQEEKIYFPETRYNYKKHKGAGALLYGVINFLQGGALDEIKAWTIPPDGKVDPASNKNRQVLAGNEKYYYFPANFDSSYGGNTNYQINFGAQYSGTETSLAQVLVSDGGAYSTSLADTPITANTLWNSVYGASSDKMYKGDLLIFKGYKHDGSFGSLIYEIEPGNDVAHLLSQINTAFNCTSSIDDKGKLRLVDNTGGDSGLQITEFLTVSFDDSLPFGGSLGSLNNWQLTSARVNFSDGSTIITDTSTLLTEVYENGSSSLSVESGDTFTFSGTASNGVFVSDLGNNTFTTGITGTTIADLLIFTENLYNDGDSSTISGDNRVKATLDSQGRIRVIDTSYNSNNVGNSFLDLSVTYTDLNSTASPWGFTDGTQVDFTSGQTSIESNINITFSGKTIQSKGRALSSNSGQPQVITSNTSRGSVFDDSSPMPLQVTNGDQLQFIGTSGDGTAITINNTYTIDTNHTVQNLLDWLENLFQCHAFIDKSGHLVLRDWKADTSSYTSSLSITDFRTPINSNGHSIFGNPSRMWQVSSQGVTIDGDYPLTDTSLPLTSIYDKFNRSIEIGDIFTVSGTDINGNAVGVTNFIVGTTGSSVAEFLSWLEQLFTGNTSGICIASIDRDGRLMITDLSGGVSSLAVNFAFNELDADGTSPWGVSQAQGTMAFTAGSQTTGFSTFTPDDGEDGSTMGDNISAEFILETQSTTQFSDDNKVIIQSYSQ
jgi:hypothetical protein